MHNFREIDSESKQVFEDTLNNLRDQFELKVIKNDVGHKLILQFEELRKYNALYVHKNVEFKNEKGSFLILLVEKHYIVKEIKGTTKNARIEDTEKQEIEPLLIFTVSEGIGRVRIRKETWSDKIEGMFNDIDIDFPSYPKFSKNYFVSGENPELIRQKFPVEVLQTLDTIPDLVLEQYGKFVLVRTERNLSEQILLLLISIGNKIVASRVS